MTETPATPQTQDIAQLLSLEEAATRRRRRLMQWGLAVLALAALAGGWLLWRGGDNAVAYRTATVEQGDLTVLVTATGVLEPVNQVEVGTEISGTVEAVLVTHNDRVRRGQPLARLNTDQSEARLRQSEAALAMAQAEEAQARVTVDETAKRLRRARALAEQNLCSEEECEAIEAESARAKAALAVARARVKQARAQVDADRTTLNKAVVRAPIDGLVLQRSIEPGQTVAASLQTPVLFTLAETLARMELLAAVDEADVGRVQVGQPASFTVDAYPGRRFPAEIIQVRYAPKTVNGVVTYDTVLTVNNGELLLRPGMTATVEITVQHFAAQTLVPNAALRFSPDSAASRGFSGGGFLMRRPGNNEQPRNSGQSAGPQVWTLRDGEPVAIPVQVLATDGVRTAVAPGAAAPGMEVLVDILHEAS